MHTIEEGVFVCPSFNSYSSNRLPEIAAKISDEFRRGSSEEEERDNDEFEFTLAEEFFYDGQSGRFFPVFNRDLILNGDFSDQGVHGEVDRSICISLSKCSVDEKEDREPRPPPTPSSSLSSEEDELESVPTGTYCMWRPRWKETMPQSRCKKSSSTGSTSFKRWKIRDLLRRSNSEGKDSFVFITPKKGGNTEGNQSGKVLKLTGKSKAKQITAGDKAAKRPSSMAAHEEFYVRSRAAKETLKRKSYLPYRQELLGFFTNINALGRTLPSF